MSIPDLVNGAFEALGAVALLGNVRHLLRDREVKGVDWRSTVFFTAWGLWNLFYYPHLGQWLSFAGGLAICVVNLVWLWLVIDIKHVQPRRRERARRRFREHCLRAAGRTS